MYYKVVKFIQVADMFGADITLNIQNKGKFTSVFGGFMSLIVWIVMLYVFISQGVDLINRVDQQAITRTINDISPNARVLNISNFMIGIKLDDPLQTLFNTTNQTMFNITVYQNHITTFPNRTRIKSVNTSLILEQCTSQHFQSLDLISDSDQLETFTNYYCLPLNYSFVLEGTYNSQHFQYTQIKVSACKNSTQCFTTDQLSLLSERQTFKLSTLMFTTIINPFSNDAIISQQLFQDFYQQTKKLQEQVSDIFLEPNTLEIDNSVFPFEKDSFFGEFWSFRLGNIRSFINDYVEPTGYFTVNLRISSEYYSSFISFKKFGDFISFIGGTLKVITSLIGIIVIKYNIIGFKLMLANTLYQCKLEDDSRSQKKAEQNDIFKFIQKEKEKAEAMLQKFRGSTKKLFQFNKVTGIFKSQRFTQIYKSDTDLLKDVQQPNNIKEIDSVKLEPTSHEYKSIDHLKDSFIQNMVEQLLIANEKIKLGLNFIVYYLSCFRHIKRFKRTYIVLQKSTININNDLDIVLILQKLQEINKIKHLLLNNNQLQLFNYIPQPIITWDGNQVQDSQQSKNSIAKLNVIGKVCRYDTRNKMLKLFRAYQEVKIDENEKEINSRLIEQLGPIVQKVFQQSHQITEDYNKMKQQDEDNHIKSNKRPPLNTTNLSQRDKMYTYGPNYLLSKSDAIEIEDIPYD
ncbi:unnamed protein product [Paramecium primaurelia]|uniref:Transmembrane protein n=1 Tax=Paramecium primaurelia TaxID=5886 RepID=A0A8S1KP64_PARPR|nr:unnamed protein product [Paramecium primaurelia]